MNLFDLFAKLTLDSSEYEKGLKDAEDKAGGFGDKLKTAMKVGTAAVAAVGTAASAMAGSFVKGASDLAGYGDAIDKQSQKMGISAQAYQEWDAILQHSGTSIDSLQRGMTTLAKAAESDSDAFKALGLTQEQIASMNQEELFAATIAGLQNMESGTERTVLAQKLLGGSAKELGALLNTSAEDTEAMRQRVHELGGVMSDEAVKSAAAYQDSLQDMQTALQGAKRGIMSDFLPSITSVMDGLTALFSGGDGAEKIDEGISGIVQKISEATPKIMQIGSKLILSLSSAITANLPLLTKAASDAIITLGTGLVQQLPAIVSAGLDILVSLATGIAENLPTLIPTIVDVVLQIVDTLTEPNTLAALVDASIAIIIALAEGLISALPKLLERAPEIVGNLVTAIVENAPKLLTAAWELIKKLGSGIIQNLPEIFSKGKEIVNKLIDGVKSLFSSIVSIGRDIINSVRDGIKQKIDEAKSWGRDLIQNFLDGITQKWNALKEKVSNVAQTVKNFLGFSEPKEGPLSDFHTYAPDMMMLFAQGIEQNAGLLRSTLTKALDFSTVSPEFPELQYSGRAVFGGYGAAYGVSEIVLLLQLILERIPSDVRLDSGELVGWLDNALGIRAAQKARGN